MLSSSGTTCPLAGCLECDPGSEVRDSNATEGGGFLHAGQGEDVAGVPEGTESATVMATALSCRHSLLREPPAAGSRALVSSAPRLTWLVPIYLFTPNMLRTPSKVVDEETAPRRLANAKLAPRSERPSESLRRIDIEQGSHRRACAWYPLPTKSAPSSTARRRFALRRHVSRSNARTRVLWTH